MDANGLKFYMLADERDWKFADERMQYDRVSRLLRLALQRPMPSWSAAEPGVAAKLLDRVPQSIDRFGTRAFWSATDGKVMATGTAGGNVPLLTPPTGHTPTDIAIGYDDLLYLALAGRITIVDPRQRFQPVDVPPPADFAAWRLAAHPEGGAWVLDRGHRQLARLIGQPSTMRPHPAYNAGVFRPLEENPNPPRLVIMERVVFDASDEQLIAVASNMEGRLAVLCSKAGEFAHLRLLDGAGNLGAPLRLVGRGDPFSLTWVSANQVALLVPGVNEAPVYTIDDSRSEIAPDGAVYPLPDHDGAPFMHGVTLPPSYPTAAGGRGLYQLSLPAYAREGWAENALLLDSGSASTTWHRLYLETTIPDHCGVVVQLAALNTPDQKPAEWYTHQFGAVFAPDGQTARGSWVPAASEIPFHPGLMNRPQVKDRSGLFTALIQRGGKRVRTLRGRYLSLRIGMQGNALATPEVAALRAYGSRFSYVDNYLPELYREDVFGPDADAPGACTPADFLGRFLGNFEGVLTPLEDRIANAYLLTDPAATPAESLDWLGTWIGVTYDGAYSEVRRRRLLAAAPELYRRRGTLRGLGLALDIATDGAVTRGQIVIVENYRLRRTFATILGANLDDANDPLTAGLSTSGNSYVGDTLFLGDELRKEFLALFGPELSLTPSDRAAIEAFVDEFAYRVTILVHRQMEREELALVRRIAVRETPAHVAVTVVQASNPFRAGVAALVGVDSYLAPKVPTLPARIDVSLIGRGHIITRLPSLDPRLSGDDVKLPEAYLSAPPAVETGRSFTLGAGTSRTFNGRKIVKYIWTRLD
jgi:phage tail-like protein